MSKTILITGATDGIGLETSKLLSAGGHKLLVHGRNAEKLAATREMLLQIGGTDESKFGERSAAAVTSGAGLTMESDQSEGTRPI